MTERQKLSEKIVREAVPRADDFQVFDQEVRGFALVVYRSGTRAFALHYRIRGRLRRYTIGRWPEWSVSAARERARLLRREIDAGLDPLAERQEQRAAATVDALVDRYCREHLPRLAPRNASDQASMLRQLVLPQWRGRPVAEITPADVERVLSIVALGRARPSKPSAPSRRKRHLEPARPTPVRANRCGEVLRKMFGLAVEWGMRPDNPAGRFRKRPEVERDRFLSADELRRVVAALEASPNQSAAGVVTMLLLTGARLGEVRCARFEQFNLELAIWTKQAATTKQRRVHRLPVSPEVVALVRLRRAAVPPGCPWLFPGEVEGQPLQDLRRFWSGVCAEAGVDGLRLHDLRHSFASFLVSGGASLEMIGKLLGHTQARTTMRYAHLMDSPLRAGVASVGALVRPRLRLVGDD